MTPFEGQRDPHDAAGKPARQRARGEHGETGSDVDSELGFALPEPAKLTLTRVVAFSALAGVVLGAGFLISYVPKVHARKELEAETRATSQAAPRVQVITPKVLQSEQALRLPSSVVPLEETVIYPRTSGYIRKWNVDIGDAVAEGDVLAEIDTPELDQQIAQARAQLVQAEAGIVQAKANAAYSKQNAARYEKLMGAGVASQEEVEKQRAQAQVDEASVRVATANVTAQRANIARLTQGKSFSRVVAPFAGTVTSRTVDRGALVTAGNATAIFKIASMDTVRVFVQVPQDVAMVIRTGADAKVSVREFPGRTFDGKIAHAAGALDPQTRTMQTVILVPNPKHELLPGMYVQALLTLPAPHAVYELPATALMNDAKGVRVAVVGADETLRFVPVTIERDTGPTIQIASGLSGDERVVKLASAELAEGRRVAVTP